jgi:hypothetical protein
LGTTRLHRNPSELNFAKGPEHTDHQFVVIGIHATGKDYEISAHKLIFYGTSNYVFITG